jgi:hypothetical protein
MAGTQSPPAPAGHRGPSTRRSPGRGGLAALCGLALLLAGCQDDGIRRYQVRKVTETEPDAADAGQAKVRLLAAIIPHGDSKWFFKLLGPEAAVGEHKEAFERFLQSVHFTDGADKPVKWTLPEGWEETAGPKVRYATLRLGAKDQPLEVWVTTFPGKVGSVLMNVNRWRKQDLGLEETTENALGQDTRDLKVDGAAATLVDLTGPGPRKAGKKPRAGGLPPGHPPARESLQYTAPKGWQEVDPRAGTVPLEAAFQVTEGGDSAKVSVLRLLGDGGGLLRNVNRWRSLDLKLGPVDEGELGKVAQTLEVAGSRASYFDLGGPDAPTRQQVLGVMLTRAGSTWFFTMKGPAALVSRQKPAFEAFVKSVRFDGGRGAADE